MDPLPRLTVALPKFPRLRDAWKTARRAGLLLAAFAPLAGLHAQSTYATPYPITTLAGVINSPGSADGTGTAARFNSSFGAAVDASGNVFVADTDNHTIRKITAAGVVTTFAGTPGSLGTADGTGSAARFHFPSGVAVDTSGNVYVADNYNHAIRKITPGGVVTTFAGTAGSGGYFDATGSAARFFHPEGVAVDGAGNVYVADSSNIVIRKITPGGVVTTLAGSQGTAGSTDGTGAAALFDFPTSIAVDGSGNLYVTDYDNETIRKITPLGTVTTLAGSVGIIGSTDGTGNAARFNGPLGVAVDGAGNVYVGDTANQTVRKITPGAVVTTLAGTALSSGASDGTGAAARFNFPRGLDVDAAGNVYVADAGNYIIRKITPGGVVTTFAGTSPFGSADGTGGAARFNLPKGAAVDGSGNVYVADSSNHTIRKITSAGVVTTFAGTAGSSGSTNATGSLARFNSPSGVDVDGSGNVYVADTANHTIRKITSGGVVTTLAGLALTSGSADGTALARFNNPGSVSVDGSGNVFVADSSNHTIRKVTSGGVVTTLAGTALTPGSTDATGAAARFDTPSGVAVDGSGNVFVADTHNCTIRKITSGGVVTTLAGSSLAAGSADGTGGAARFNYPSGVAVDGSGNVYVSDSFNDTLRKVTSGGVVTTLAGTAGSTGNTDGTGRAARLNYPVGLTLDAAGNLYVADSNNCNIRKAVAAGGLAGDFNSDGNADIVWENTTSGDRGFYLMNGTTFGSWVNFGTIPTAWRIAATADFNGDGKTDILWENTATGDRGFYLMNGTAFVSWVDLGTVSTNWRMAAVGDFNGDGKPDILWENTSTGARGIYLMNGTTFVSWVDLGTIATALRIVGTGDFNGDGQTDILWENTSTGKRVIWFMNGTTFTSSFSLGIVSTDWRMAAVGDFNSDGKPDILWENTVSGDRGFWLMNGTTFGSWVDLGTVTTDWNIAN